MSVPAGKHSAEELIGNAVENIFKKYDENQNNYIDLPEFRKMIEDLDLDPRIKMSGREINNIFDMLDVNGDGRVSRQELVQAFLAIKTSIE
jgi:Ca2+-binding EF-hand superfamily protein